MNHTIIITYYLKKKKKNVKNPDFNDPKFGPNLRSNIITAITISITDVILIKASRRTLLAGKHSKPALFSRNRQTLEYTAQVSPLIEFPSYYGEILPPRTVRKLPKEETETRELRLASVARCNHVARWNAWDRNDERANAIQPPASRY